MTTPPQTLSETVSDARSSGVSGAVLRGLPALMQGLRDFGVFLGDERHWFLVGAIYLFAWYNPATWAWSQWSNPSATQCFEPFVPIGTALLIWGQRARLAALWRRVTSEHSSVSRRQRKGNFFPLALGCVLLLVANIIQVKGAANVALVLIAAGVLYQVYGPLMLRALAVPLLFFCLIIMPPDNMTDRLTNLFLAASIKMAAGLLNALHRGSLGQYYLLGAQSLHLPTATVDLIASGCRGFSSAVPVAVALACWMLYRQVRFNYGLMVVFGGFVLALVVNVARIVLVAELYRSNPLQGDALKDANNFLFIVPVFFLTLYAARGMEWLLKRSPAPVQKALNRAGNVVNLLVYPFVFLLTQLGRIFTLQKSAERGLERFLKNITPKKKRRR